MLKSRSAASGAPSPAYRNPITGLRRNRRIRSAYAWLTQFIDAGRLFRGLTGLGWFWSDYRRYRRLAATANGPGPAAAVPLELLPMLHERAPEHELDAHYFYVNAWAMRRVRAAAPAHHVDVGSQLALVGQLSALLPVTYLDYRPVDAPLPGLSRVSGSLLALPCADGSLSSVSCLHVAEHVGLGRYGDPLDPAGTRKAARELERVLAPGGNLYFAVPIGRPRICFNAHRVHSIEMVLELFPRLRLRELSGVTDAGRFVENVGPDAFAGSEYACGMFWLDRPVA